MSAVAHEMQPEIASAIRPVRVLFIIDSIWGVGGAEMCLLRLVRDLQVNGYECRILTFHTSDVAAPFRRGFPCEILHWPMENLRSLKAIAIAIRLARLVRRLQIDIVHTFFNVSDLWAGPIAKLCGAKVLISSRRDMGFRRGPFSTLAYRVFHTYYDQIHAVSNEVRRFTIDRDRSDPSRTVTIYNGVEETTNIDPEEVQRLRRLIGVDSSSLIISCVANMRYVKGIDVMVRAAAQVRERHANVRFVVAGSFGAGENLAYSRSVVALAEDLGLAGSILFLDQITAVSELLNISDIFILPSRTEGLSNALLESMRAGLPCVATAVGGNPEAVQDEVSGFIVPSEDHKSMALRLNQLIESPPLRRQMGDAARERVTGVFSIANMSRAVQESYSSLLTSRARI